ncbi:hypothetical protein CEXT_162171 [Caerostris extrusa]|uniref:Uncharacterized protein n=1 Tax=Caerostris extrusa TaxID=172846 RepID=A0AAV4VAY3_CAEEX|nr:hypothetical protein CEXT_162171 [Caerostris extrusa]
MIELNYHNLCASFPSYSFRTERLVGLHVLYGISGIDKGNLGLALLVMFELNYHNFRTEQAVYQATSSLL